ncbi:MAG: dihydroorotase [Acidobacteria bacterium]|nr:MAG: dihydroorotase [Acidobacteriota bacterium]REK04630.1 MAG: dihydroorotase [Acidobacteriota bacterium]
MLVRGGRVVDPSQGIDDEVDVLIGDDGRVERLSGSIQVGEGVEVLDAAGLVVCPGLLDLHVHLREPGQEYKETIESGSRAAAAGGFTTVACMANTVPVNDCRSVTEHIVRAAQRCGLARVLPVGAISKGLRGEELAEMGDLVSAGVVAFSDDGRPVEHAELMRRALLYARHFGLPVVQHAQDMTVTGDGAMHEGPSSTRLGVPGVPRLAEDLMVARDLLLAEETGGRYHVQHLSSGRSVELIREAKARGVAVTCEVTPHHLLLTDRDVEESGLDPNFKMNPPLRESADRDALLAGLLDGTIDFIASDHAPHHVDEKLLDFVASPFGIVGLETTVSLLLDRLVHAGKIELGEMIRLLTSAPAKAFGLELGSLRPGAPGDVTLLDLEREVTVDPARFQSKSRNTPFAGWRLRGAPVVTVLAGRPIRVEPRPER